MRPYEKLANVLADAFARATRGKGKERHVSGGEFFEEQYILRGARQFGLGGLQFQVGKKLEEVDNLQSTEAKINEFLDIIVYSAAAVILLEEIKEREDIEELMTCLQEEIKR